MYKAARGTVDILPEEQAYWRYFIDVAVRLAELYGYARIDTPAFEEAGLFSRSIGEGTDIVEKEMYTFQDKGGNELTLRPEGTAPVCRAYLEHGMASLPQPVKLYYQAAIFRYERPQAGRYREHHQFGCEAFGDADPALDAEVIDLAWRLCQSLGLYNLKLKINSIGCRKCRPAYLAALKEYYQRSAAGLCADCRVRLERNPLRLLDCKQASCQGVAEVAPKSASHLCPECAAHFNTLTGYLTGLGLPFEVSHRLVRGLDYYTRTVFEIQPETEGGQSTICGGGRYDDLIEELGGKPTPAIGFATGIERVILNLKRQEIAVPELPRPRVFIAPIGGAARTEALKLAQRLRDTGIGVIVAAGERSLKAQLRQANSLGMSYTVIIGEDEIKAGTVALRDMKTSEQETLSLAGLDEALACHLKIS
jgi:histidyl-tRNA synthetase